MDMRADKDKKFNIAYTTLSDLEKYQKCDAELARHLMTRMEKSGAKPNANMTKKNQTAKPMITKYTFIKASELGEGSTNQGNREREAENPQDRPFYNVDRVLLLKIAMIGKLQLDELKSWLGSHWGCVDGSMPASANNPLDIAGVQLVASFSFATCEQILCSRTIFSSFNHQGELLLYQT
ncbi:hypothetical protein TSUD_193230 [Trifolium subterraneum]|uniref:Uncharacterized protein n=1 Tax=Trifolium subterraneum TaxID=3900 RepID=A0A2Z6MRZ2_TRISU|nr:hypothetical protein TSUD_193230 [Trifolium subterraneum]